MKKLTYLILVMLLSTTLTEAVAMNLFKKNESFKFEDYEKAEDAKKALLKMHPVGSSVEDLVKTLEKAGAKTSNIKEKERKFMKINDGQTIKGYSYFEKRNILNPLLGGITGYDWGGGIVYEIHSHKIVRYGISRRAEGY